MRRRVLWSIVACAAVAVGWWVAGLAPFSGRATFAVVALGTAAALAGRILSPPAVHGPGGAGLGWWLAPLALLAGWQVAALRAAPRVDHPTLSYLANAALEPRPARAVAVASWLFVAGWLGRR